MSNELGELQGDVAGGAPRMRADERREQLTRVAISLFAKKGFNGTTTKEIAAAAGVTEALIFRHFPSKEALYGAILLWQIETSGGERMLDTLREFADARDDYGLFHSLIESILAFHRANPEFQRLMLYAALEGHDLADAYRERFVRSLHDFLIEYVATRQREGAFRAIDPEAAVRAIVAMPLHQSLVTNLFRCSFGEVSDTDAANEFTRMAVCGLKCEEAK